MNWYCTGIGNEVLLILLAMCMKNTLKFSITKQSLCKDSKWQFTQKEYKRRYLEKCSCVYTIEVNGGNNVWIPIFFVLLFCASYRSYRFEMTWGLQATTNRNKFLHWFRLLKHQLHLKYIPSTYDKDISANPTLQNLYFCFPKACLASLSSPSLSEGLID